MTEADALYAITPDALMAQLAAMGIAYNLHHHEAIFTAADGHHLKAIIPGVHVKNLFVRDKRERMALIVVPDELQLDLKSLAPAIGLDRLSFGSPERLWKHLGVRPGSVCPYAIMNDRDKIVKLVIDESVANAAMVVAHPMINTMSVALGSADMLRFLKTTGHEPQILDLASYSRCDAA